MNWDVLVMIVHRAFLVQKSIIAKKLRPLMQSVLCSDVRLAFSCLPCITQERTQGEKAMVD